MDDDKLLGIAIAAFCLHLFSVAFNVVFLIAVYRFKGMNPKSYMYSMAFCELLLNVFVFYYELPLWIPGTMSQELREVAGPYTTLCIMFCYQFRLFLSPLMTINRLVIVLWPQLDGLFHNRRIAQYCIFIVVMLFGLLLVPFFSPCYVNYYWKTHEFASGCVHLMTWLQGRLLILSPAFSVTANAVMVAYFRFQRTRVYAQLKSHFCARTEDLSMSSATALSMKYRRRLENTVLVQAVVTSFYLSIFELGRAFLLLFPDFFERLPPWADLLFFYGRGLSPLLLNFVVYFVCLSGMRREIVAVIFPGIQQRGSATFAPVAGNPNS